MSKSTDPNSLAQSKYCPKVQVAPVLWEEKECLHYKRCNSEAEVLSTNQEEVSMRESCSQGDISERNESNLVESF